MYVHFNMYRSVSHNQCTLSSHGCRHVNKNNNVDSATWRCAAYGVGHALHYLHSKTTNILFESSSLQCREASQYPILHIRQFSSTRVVNGSNLTEAHSILALLGSLKHLNLYVQRKLLYFIHTLTTCLLLAAHPAAGN